MKSGSGLADNGAAWRQAAEYIGARLANTNNPTEAIITNTLNMRLRKLIPMLVLQANQQLLIRLVINLIP